MRLAKGLTKSFYDYIAFPMLRRLFLYMLVLCLPVLFSSCSSQRPVEIGSTFSPSCRLVTGESALDREIVIGVDPAVLSGISAVSEMAPAMSSRRSRLAVLDCEGTLQLGAASGWKKMDEGKSWHFDLHQTLYPADTFSLPAKPLTASDLTEKWEHNISKFEALEGIEALSAYEIVFHLKDAQNSFPLLLISPHFSLDVQGAQPGIVKRLDPSADARDVLEDDSGIVGLITMNQDVIEYAFSQPAWISRPLPWDRSYVMVTKSNTPAESDTSPVFPVSISSSFVRDVVTSKARVYQPSSWWDQASACGVSFGEGASVDLNPLNDRLNILYPKADETARVLAERLTALASGAISVAGSDSLSALLPKMDSANYKWSAVPIPSATGFDEVYIVSLPRQVFDPCLAMENLRSAMPWLFDQASGHPYTFIPLLDTRPTLIVRKGAVHVDVDGFGWLYVSHPSGGNQE